MQNTASNILSFSTRTRRHVIMLNGILILWTLSVHGTSGQSASDNNVVPSVQESCYCLKEFASELYAPTGAVFTKDKDGTEVALVVEQRGVIRAVSGGKTRMFMDIRDRVYVTNKMGDSRGLLSAVLSPDYQRDGKIYVYYIRRVLGEDFAYVSQFQAVDFKVDTSSERFLLRLRQPFQHGNGGPMVFGDDGYLYIVTGDGGADDDNLGHAQNKNSFHGSVLRIDARAGQQTFTRGDSATAKMYSIPADNPFANDTNALGEIFAVGFRNPWGCSVDSKSVGGDGRLYCVDTGTDQYDEVNVVEKGKNYGWNIKEGSVCLNKTDCGAIVNEGVPIFEFQHVTHHAMVGGFVYRGTSLAWMNNKGLYTFADIVSGETYYLEEDMSTKKWQVHLWSRCEAHKCPGDSRAEPLRHLFAFAQDTKGEVYFLMVRQMTALSPMGKMYKLVGASRSAAFPAPSVVHSVSLSLIAILSIQLMTTL